MAGDETRRQKALEDVKRLQREEAEAQDAREWEACLAKKERHKERRWNAKARRQAMVVARTLCAQLKREEITVGQARRVAAKIDCSRSKE
jgi:hypothetical protein